MATSRSTARRAKRARGGEAADSGTTGVTGTRASAAKFRQSIDASPGVTAILFRGERFRSHADLHKAHPEAKDLAKGKRGAVVGPGSERKSFWPEMQLREPAPDEAGEEQEEEQTDEESGGAGTRESGDGYTEADLEPLTDAELRELADARGITVKSGKGRGRGKPKRADYLAALLGK